MGGMELEKRYGLDLWRDGAAECLSEGTGDDLDLAAEVVALGNTASGLAYDTCGVRLIDHNHGIVLLGEGVDLIERADVAVH